MRQLRYTYSAGVALLFLWGSLAWAGDIYYWTDANGIKHFTNQTPPAEAKLFVKNVFRSEQQTASEQSLSDDNEMEEMLAKQQELEDRLLDSRLQLAEAERRVDQLEAAMQSDRASQLDQEIDDAAYDTYPEEYIPYSDTRYVSSGYYPVGSYYGSRYGHSRYHHHSKRYHHHKYKHHHIKDKHSGYRQYKHRHAHKKHHFNPDHYGYKERGYGYKSGGYLKGYHYRKNSARAQYYKHRGSISHSRSYHSGFHHRGGSGYSRAGFRR